MKHTLQIPSASACTLNGTVPHRDAPLAFGPPLLITAPLLGPGPRPRPWLYLLNDVDQEDSMEYHNPMLSRLGPPA